MNISNDSAATRARLTRAVLVGALAISAVALARLAIPVRLTRTGGELTGLLAAIAALSYAGTQVMLDRLGRAFDSGTVIVAVALVGAGPLPALAIVLIPEAIRFVRRPASRRSLGLLATVTSLVAAIAAAQLSVDAVGGARALAGVPAALAGGATIVLVNYAIARLLYAVLYERASARQLLATELRAAAWPEAGLLALAAIMLLALNLVGLLALTPLALVVALPPVAVATVLRARSVGQIDVGAATSAYRAALIDELRLPASKRRAVQLAAAIREQRPQTPANDAERRAALAYALELQTIADRPPTQVAYRARLGTQILLVSERWAQLTARETRALSHTEALAELAIRDTHQDAPQGFAAACRVAMRETELAGLSTTVPRLHTLPLPRALRGDPLLASIQRLRA